MNSPKASSPYFSRLKTFAFLYKYDEAIRFLAKNLAEIEDWDFSDSQTERFSILKNYIEFTFRRIKQENKIVFSEDNKFASFNLGLQTDNLEDIFLFFTKNNKNGPPYFLKAFLKESDNLMINNFSQNIPEIANYFSKPEDLIFNPKLNLIPNIDHIIKDNIDRFPAELKNQDKRDVRRALIGSIDEVKKRLRTNYKIAIPQFYEGRIQLLIPLCLTRGSSNPDLALAVEKVNISTYTARTCLTLKMAYINARLIVKPQSNWLKP